MKKVSFEDRFAIANQLMLSCIQDALKAIRGRADNLVLDSFAMHNVDLSDDYQIVGLAADLVDAGAWSDIGRILDFADEDASASEPTVASSPTE